MNNNLIFSLDIESNGLLGEAFAVGVVVLDKKTCEVVDKFEGKVNIKITSEFVIQEVLPKLPKVREVKTLESLDLEFYAFYKKYADAEILVDAGFPVEANFLQRVFNRIENPIMPYPLVDVMSVLIGLKKDPMLNRHKYVNRRLRKHHPVDDALASALVYIDLMKESD